MFDAQRVIVNIGQQVQSKLAVECTGHDWYHVMRVHRLAKYIAEAEGANLLVVELAALLHDIADWKFYGDEDAGPQQARTLLEIAEVNSTVVEEVCFIIKHMTFKGASVRQVALSLEGQVVQDADRLDALGAIGIARAFAYGGCKGNMIYDPHINPEQHTSFEQYKAGGVTTINHFYEKLLLLKDRMNTATGKQLSMKRHAYMEEFLNQFYTEWNGEI